MNVDRLQTLARYLRTYYRPTWLDRLKALFGLVTPKKAFNMNLWSCSTAACALGTACTIPEFKALGLEAVLFADHDDDRDEDGNRMFHAIPEFDGSEGFTAGARFFGIDYAAAAYLFDPASYDNSPFFSDEPAPTITPEMVADRIDSLIANGGEAPEPEDYQETY